MEVLCSKVADWRLATQWAGSKRVSDRQLIRSQLQRQLARQLVSKALNHAGLEASGIMMEKPVPRLQFHAAMLPCMPCACSSVACRQPQTSGTSSP